MRISMLIVIFMVPFQIFASGNEGAHGGSSVALDFKAAAHEAIQFIRSFSQNLEDLKCYNLEGAIDRATIYSTQEELMVIAGAGELLQRSVAVSIPEENKIIIDSNSWQNIGDRSLQEALALHEILILLGLEKTGDYHYSYQYLFDLSNVNECAYPNTCEPQFSSCLLVKNQSFASSYIATEYFSKKDKNNYKQILTVPREDIKIEFVFDHLLSYRKSMSLNIEKKNVKIFGMKGLGFVEFPGHISFSWKDTLEEAEWELICKRS